ncbi:hypothetical protein EW146_g1807 [Bondarzewia mesenterica]|uniref:BTB domain-containing protein n=1 Tax=Bondarzewia mesenterica TaxID=1095465 RepID=A0A4S4M2Q1_9AGAM|nr:hypothetical protein EW146_g1807 [Bondarzewia mesenterica]
MELGIVEAEVLPPSRHQTYYIVENNLSIFLVSGCLFRVHRYLFEESPVFRDMFSIPPGEEGVEGESDTAPIVLPEITQQEFEALLDFLYDRGYDGYRDFNVRKWINVLSISSRFEFDKVRARAIKELTELEPSLDAIEEILLAQKYEVPQWIFPGLTKLLIRSKIPDLSEAERLPLDMVLSVWRAREEFIRAQSQRSAFVTPNPQTYLRKHFNCPPYTT